MSLTAVDRLFNETRMLRRAQQLVGERPGARFNIFSVLGMEADEVYTHSRFLAELLHPHGAHGMGDVFLQRWLAQLEVADFNTEQAYCVAEHYLGPVTDTHGGRIDLLIHNRAASISIENKIFAGDQPNQLLRYYNAFPQGRLYYLTLFGTPPSRESIGQGKLADNRYTCISYVEHVLPWLEQCAKEASGVATLRETIVQYIALIKKLTNQHFDKKMQQELVQKILDQPDNLRSFFELQSPGTLQAVYQQLTEKMERDLQELCDRMNLKLGFYLKTRNRWHGFTIYDDGQMANWNIWIDFQFDQFPNGFKFGFSFRPDSAGQPCKPGGDLAPLISRFRTAYARARTHEWWPVYTYLDYSAADVCNDIYFSQKFIGLVEEKVRQLLDMVTGTAKEEQ